MYQLGIGIQGRDGVEIHRAPTGPPAPWTGGSCGSTASTPRPASATPPARHLHVAARSPARWWPSSSSGVTSSRRSGRTRERSLSSSTCGRRARSTCRPRAASSTTGPPATSARASAGSRSTSSPERMSPAGSTTWPPVASTPGGRSRSSEWCCGRPWTRPSPRAACVAARRRGSACRARSSSPTGCARCRRGPRTTRSSWPPARTTAGTARSGPTSSTGSAAPSSSASSAATSTSRPAPSASSGRSPRSAAARRGPTARTPALAGRSRSTR